MHIQKTLFIMKFLTKSIYFKSDCRQILSRKRFCSSSGQNIGQYIRHIVAGCSYQHTSFPIVQNSKGYFEKKDKICKIKKKNKMADTVQYYTKNGVPPYVWMSPVHTQHKESIRLRGCPYAPIHLDAHICLDSPCMFGCPCMFECSLCLNAPCMFGQPQCLDVPICLDAPCTYTTQRKDTLSDKGGVHMPPYIWTPPVHKQHKESMLCQTKGVSICPHRFRCHHLLGYHLYVGLPPLCLDAAICLDAPTVCLNATLCLNTPICLDTLYVWMSPYVWTPSYVWMPTCMFGHTPCLHSPYVWVPPIFGHPSVWLDIPTCLDTPCMFGCPPNVWPPPVCLDVGIQTYGSVQMYEGHPNIQGVI